ncbi:MAG: hypothetical protein K5663_01510 [Clostridiales bacterium]|nr:hypothetical protein [Clostridiales bacterium]
MAKIDFGSIKDRFSKHNSINGKSEEEFDEEGSFDDEFVPDDTSENEDFYPDDNAEEYDDVPSDEEEYEDDSYAEGDDSDEYYDETDASGEDYYGEASPEDENYEEDGYAEDDDYIDDGDADDYEDDGEDLGYNPDLFDEMRSENGEEEYDGEYEDEYADEYPAENDEEGQYYDDENSEGTGWYGKIQSTLDGSPILLYLLLALPVLQLFAIWYLWHKGLFDKTKRWILTAIGILFIILWVIIFWPRGGGSNDPVNGLDDGPDFSQNVVFPVNTAETATTPTPTPTPSTEITPDLTSVATLPEDNTGANYVWTSNSGLYYHTREDCPNLGGLAISKVTLDLAIQRGRTACPVCSGGNDQFNSGETGTSTPSGTTLYATTKGKWYHIDKNCQGMTNATVVTEANAIKAGKTACPVCIGYYGTAGGKWYHCYSNCQSMSNAVAKTKSEWEAMGKTACPVCLAGNGSININSIPSETQVFATQGGKYFHTKNNCSGMKDASQIAISTAVKYGKTACPTCVKPANIWVFARTDGTYYHTKATCSSMKNASYVTAKTAISAGKKACPTCNARNLSGSTAAADGGNGGTTTTKLTGTTTTDTNTYVYATKNGTYCHTNSTCSGMTGANRVTLQSAINAGKKACPTCFKSGNVNVFATSGGKYYHTKSNCSGMNKPLTVTVAKAIAAGKTACPTCAKQLGTLFDKKTTNSANNQAGNTAANNKNASASASTVVYIKTGTNTAKYYHKAAKCTAQGVTGGTSVTLEYALGKGYKACPSCNPPSKIST